jgi:hypothetical protein
MVQSSSYGNIVETTPGILIANSRLVARGSVRIVEWDGAKIAAGGTTLCL